VKVLGWPSTGKLSFIVNLPSLSSLILTGIIYFPPNIPVFFSYCPWKMMSSFWLCWVRLTYCFICRALIYCSLGSILEEEAPWWNCVLWDSSTLVFIVWDFFYGAVPNRAFKLPIALFAWKSAVSLATSYFYAIAFI
jgi:hypothetical protein